MITSVDSPAVMPEIHLPSMDDLQDSGAGAAAADGVAVTAASIIEKLRLAEAAFAQEADVIDDMNDLVDMMIRFLPKRCWLELDASFPAGQFYIPGLAVNKLLNITSDNLTAMLGPQKGRNLQSGVIFNASEVGRLGRPGGSRAIFIYVDPTGEGPRDGPGYPLLCVDFF